MVTTACRVGGLPVAPPPALLSWFGTHHLATYACNMYRVVGLSALALQATHYLVARLAATSGLLAAAVADGASPLPDIFTVLFNAGPVSVGWARHALDVWWRPARAYHALRLCFSCAQRRFWTGGVAACSDTPTKIVPPLRTPHPAGWPGELSVPATYTRHVGTLSNPTLLPDTSFETGGSGSWRGGVLPSACMPYSVSIRASNNRLSCLCLPAPLV